MYAAAIRRLLEMYPAGASCDQLLYHLRTSGIRATAADILQSLNLLSGNGEIGVVAKGRWILSKFLNTGMSSPRIPKKPEMQPTNVLRAVSGSIQHRPSSESGMSDATAGKNSDLSWPLEQHWRALFRYYAATQRADPRGKVTQFPDRHGEAWQLFLVHGCWWKDAILRFPMNDLPEPLRETLSRRKESACAVGYPVSHFESVIGSEMLPALLVNASWKIADHNLIIEISSTEPVINPDWLKKIVAKSAWKADTLTDALFPVGEETDLDAVIFRMRYALAKLGGGHLSPGKLAEELTLGHDGLRNCAAIFLPSDTRFTQSTATDLDTLAGWSEEEYKSSAICKLFSTNESSDELRNLKNSIPLLQLRDMTERQFKAAKTALDSHLTLIQGPPGTGKSDIIVSLLASIFMAGGSVLFASKNHQALDEVEARLLKLVGQNPVLTRGRDADGDRDTNFLAALKELTGVEPRKESQPPTIETLVAAAEAESSNWCLISKRASLEIELAEALDRALALEALGQPVERHNPSFWQKMLDQLASILRLARGKLDGPLQESARPSEIRRRIEALRRAIASLDSLKSTPIYSSPQDRILALAPFIENFAKFITRIDTPTRTTLFNRIKDLEFNGVNKSKKLLAEDARLLLNHRPIWAISTLSVPSRMPLVAGLFDYVIIDEASQCDIASALPLIARAKRAIVVGDPLQLSFIPQLSRQQEHALMDSAGLPKSGRHSVAQSANSLFDFTGKRPMRRELFLSDQFRSSPGIVDYINDEFYGGRLVGRREPDEMNIPRDYKPGLEWHNVKGRPGREEDGNINVIEADTIVNLVVDMVRERKFDGSIGILSPFAAQVGRILRLIQERLSSDEQAKVSLKVATIDKFQGGEADVILFSPVIGHGADFSITNFLKRERRRLNVAISRARALCLVVGDLDYALKSDIPHIRSLARHAITPFSPPRTTFDSEWERRLDTAMKRRGLKPHPQYAVGRKYLDFALFAGEIKLDIEVDGRAFHTDQDGNRKISDLLRDKELIARNWKVRRFWVSELNYDMETCLDRIESDLR